MSASYKCISRFTLIAGVMLLSACTRSISDVDSQGKTTVPVFPDATTAVRPEGSFVNLDNLKQVKPGMTKNQIYELIGVPHFKEGVFKVKEWDYIFHFTKADGSVLTCQYKALFDSEMKAQSFYYQPTNCLDGLKKNAAELQPAKQDRETLSTASLFAFGSAELSANGIAQISQLSDKLKRGNITAKHILITGHSDRIGQAVENQRLSQARADSVKAVLVAEGISSSIIESRGVGASEPVVTCPGKATAPVIACLAKNRRITVDVTE